MSEPVTSAICTEMVQYKHKNSSGWVSWKRARIQELKDEETSLSSGQPIDKFSAKSTVTHKKNLLAPKLVNLLYCQDPRLMRQSRTLF